MDHQGRVTVPKRRPDAVADTMRPGTSPTVPARAERPVPAPTARTTPRRLPPLRPGWHRWVGWPLIVFGVLVAVLNDAMLFRQGLTLLPGGHMELYLLLGLTLVGVGTWFLGVYDRTKPH